VFGPPAGGVYVGVRQEGEQRGAVVGDVVDELVVLVVAVGLLVEQFDPGGEVVDDSEA
jgi:hypothetical protein